MCIKKKKKIIAIIDIVELQVRIGMGVKII